MCAYMHVHVHVHGGNCGRHMQSNDYGLSHYVSGVLWWGIFKYYEGQMVCQFMGSVVSLKPRAS